ncbi:hypothetical protein V5O48_007199 [Marasmius crinis-equi]|uniref:Uncharacterized protein n=1 Tax=Marasmius crinis-equi TaxID=585013 RepID=A0ABR3FHG9_9AGAR
MPTATSTVTMTVPKEPSTKTLRSLYNRAAKAFLNRNISLTHSLLQSAFDTLNTDSPASSVDFLHILRKWDILRITFETTVYSSPAGADFPEQLRQISLKTPHALVKDMYNRSLASFSKDKTSTTATLLPVQVVSTLVYSSLKVDAPQIGREIIEEWLARRGSSLGYIPPSSPEEDGYEKALELYCLQILPKLEEWEYATEFLQYESELSVESRLRLQNSLRTQHVQAVSSRLAPPITPQSTTPYDVSRSQSPTPSSSSSSSSLSTTSTHTVTPATLHQHAMTPLASSSSSSASSEGTLTPNGNGHIPNGDPAHGHRYPNGNGYAHHHSKDKGKGKARSPTTRSVASGSGSALSRRAVSASPPSSSTAHPVSHHPLNPHSPNPLSLPRSHISRGGGSRGDSGRMTTYALIRASLEPYWSKLVNMGGSKISAVVLMVILPVISVIVRWRTRRRAGAGGAFSANNADLVRRRLRNVNAGESQTKALAMMLVRMWWAFFRSIMDTVRMGVSGLV